MFANFLTSKLGLTRDSVTWLILKILSVCGMVASGAVDIPGLGAWLGLTITPTESHWATALCVLVMWFAGSHDASPLKGASSPGDGSVSKSTLTGLSKGDSSAAIVLLAVALGGLVTLSGCGLKPPATITTTQGKTAYTADQLVLRLQEVENAAIAANAAGGLSDATTAVVVKFCISAGDTAKAAALGWQAAVQTAWADAKKSIPPADAQKFALDISAIDLAVDLLQAVPS